MIVAATTSVLLGSSSSMAAIDSSACYLDTGYTSIMTNNSALLFGAVQSRVPITTGNSGAMTSASFQGTARFRSPITRRLFAFDQSLYCEQLPCTLVPLTVMRRVGLKSVLDEDSLAFRFYYRHELQFSAAVDETGLYRLDWELSLNPDPCLLYTSPSPRDGLLSRMPSSA